MKIDIYFDIGIMIRTIRNSSGSGLVGESRRLRTKCIHRAHTKHRSFVVVVLVLLVVILLGEGLVLLVVAMVQSW